VKYLLLGSSIALLVMISIGCGSAPSAQSQPPVTVTLRNPYTGVVGNASLSPDSSGGVKVSVQVKGLTPGKHGFHIHATGKCDGFDFASAGGHFNPNSKQHGLQNPQGAHGGDMPNLEVRADGSGTFEYVTKQVTLGSGVNSLFQPGGTALVIHAAEDDEKTDPAGNSGARVACGVIVNPGSLPGASN
jgi:Cu-Zn family superoxide dismutase